MRTDFFEEFIEFKGIVGIEVIYYRHRVPFYSVLFSRLMPCITLTKDGLPSLFYGIRHETPAARR